MNQTLIGALGAALLALGVSGIAWSDHDHDRIGKPRAQATGGKATQARYQTECGGCHLAYPPGLMPREGWQQVMATLANHFGDDASLDQAASAEILGYLTANAGNRGSRASLGAPVPNAAKQEPPRITQTRYFLHKHDEVPARLVSNNPKVGSFSNCQACHGGAAQGNFDEDRVNIPGVGRWED